MEPLALATSFASIVGLLGQFTSSIVSSKQQTTDKYLEWLREHDLSDLADAIASNTGLYEAIGFLLANQHSELVSKLEDMGTVLNLVASRFADFAPLADGLGVKSRLSDQALSVLQQMNAANASTLIESGSNRGMMYIMSGTGKGNLKIADKRLIRSDIDELRTLGLLARVVESGENPIHFITRAGVKVGESARGVEK